MVTPDGPPRDRRSFLKPVDLGGLDRKVRQAEAATRRTGIRLANFEPTTVPMLQFPSGGGGSGGSISWTPLAPTTSFPITTVANGGMSADLPVSPTNGSPWYVGKPALDEDDVLGLGAGAIVVPTGLIRQGSDHPSSQSLQNVLVINPANFNVVTTIAGPPPISSSSAYLPGECFFWAGYLWLVAARTSSGSSWGGFSELFRYDTATSSWTSVQFATPLNATVAGDNLYFGGGTSQLLALDAANPTATPVTASPLSNSRWLVGGPNALWFYYRSGSSGPNYWAYRADDLSPTAPVFAFQSMQANIDIIHHPCVDASGRMWAINSSGGLVQVQTNGTATTYPGVVPTDPAVGAPVFYNTAPSIAFGGLSAMVQGPDDSFFFGAAIQADVVGGDPGYFRASIWQVSPAGSGTVWIDTEDAGLYETDGDMVGIPHVSGLTRQGDRLLFTVNCTSGERGTGAFDLANFKTRRIVQSLTIS